MLFCSRAGACLRRPIRKETGKIVGSPRHTPSLELGPRPSLTSSLPSYAGCLLEPQSSSLYSGNLIPFLQILGEMLRSMAAHHRPVYRRWEEPQALGNLCSRGTPQKRAWLSSRQGPGQQPGSNCSQPPSFKQLTFLRSAHAPLVQEGGAPGASTLAAVAGCPEVRLESKEAEAVVHPKGLKARDLG